MSVGQTAGSNLFVNIQCTVAVATGYDINVLILGGWTGETEVTGAWMGKDAIFLDDIEISIVFRESWHIFLR